jgi:hypothetical protein
MKDDIRICFTKVKGGTFQKSPVTGDTTRKGSSAKGAFSFDASLT